MLSKRSEVDPFIVMEIVAEAFRREEAGQSMIHMEVGQPGTAAPKLALEAVRAHLQDPLGYSLSNGRRDLREALARKYRQDYGLKIDPARFIVTNGSSGAFQLAFIALFDAGQKLAIAEPGYPSYRNIIKALSLEEVPIVTSLQNGFQPTPGDISKDQMDGILVASPANPTGTVLPRQALEALMGKAKDEGVVFISDEIYHGLTYGEQAVCALEIDPDAIVINSCSKYYSMTGWRLGWIIVPEMMVQNFERLAQNLFICAPHISQIAALGALVADEENEARRAVYARNREHLKSALEAIGFDRFSPPDGGFYYYVDVSEHCADSRELIEAWLDYGVAATPGWDFDPKRGGQYLRLSYCASEADILEGIKRLKLWAADRSSLQPQK